MTKTEHPVGSRFEIDGIIYEVRPAHSCQGCSLYIEEENECLDRHGRFGHCDGNNRSDGQDVKFVQVGERYQILHYSLFTFHFTK